MTTDKHWPQQADWNSETTAGIRSLKGRESTRTQTKKGYRIILTGNKRKLHVFYCLESSDGQIRLMKHKAAITMMKISKIFPRRMTKWKKQLYCMAIPDNTFSTYCRNQTVILKHRSINTRHITNIMSIYKRKHWFVWFVLAAHGITINLQITTESSMQVLLITLAFFGLIVTSNITANRIRKSINKKLRYYW